MKKQSIHSDQKQKQDRAKINNFENSRFESYRNQNPLTQRLDYYSFPIPTLKL